jgi:hypothetical protein
VDNNGSRYIEFRAKSPRALLAFFGLSKEGYAARTLSTSKFPLPPCIFRGRGISEFCFELDKQVA